MGFPFAWLQVIQGSSTPVIKSLRETLNMPRPRTFDMVFIDHHKVSRGLPIQFELELTRDESF
jgi:hypothetical protein